MKKSYKKWLTSEKKSETSEKSHKLVKKSWLTSEIKTETKTIKFKW